MPSRKGTQKLFRTVEEIKDVSLTGMILLARRVKSLGFEAITAPKAVSGGIIVDKKQGKWYVVMHHILMKRSVGYDIV